MQYKTALFCEFDKCAATSYAAIHGVDPALVATESKKTLCVLME